MRVETGDRALIAGTIITGSAAKKIIIRAIGPSLSSSGISDALADPVLELYGADGTLITSNDNWKDTQQAEIEASGVKPVNDKEAAIVATLMPGNYTAVLRGKDNTTGVAVAELYDLDTAVDSRLGNISTRGFVQTGENVMIGGFILGGNNNIGSVIIRGLGPSLTGGRRRTRWLIRPFSCSTRTAISSGQTTTGRTMRPGVADQRERRRTAERARVRPGRHVARRPIHRHPRRQERHHRHRPRRGL